MPMYENTPLASDWEKIKRQREIADVLAKQSLLGGGNEMVSGRVIPGWSKDIGRMGKALVSGYSGRKSDEQQQALSDRYDAESKAAMEGVVDTIRGRGGVSADPRKAALDATVDPYLRGNRSTQSVIDAMIKAEAVKQGRGGSPYYGTEFGKEGRNTHTHTYFIYMSLIDFLYLCIYYTAQTVYKFYICVCMHMCVHTYVCIRMHVHVHVYARMARVIVAVE